MTVSNHCRVCGYDWGEPPWGVTGKTPSFEICPVCEVEAGYEDNSPESTRAYRAAWLAEGAPWDDDDVPHDGLSTVERLRRVPPGYESD